MAQELLCTQTKNYILIMKKVLLFTFLSILFFGANETWAQGSTTSAMRGTIFDENGDALPGAVVVAVHEPTGSKYTVATDATGTFNIRNMNVGGPYKITIQFVGYENYERTNTYLKLGQTFTLKVDMKQESSEIEGVTVLAVKDNIFDGNRTGARTNIDEETINALPTAGRDLTDFTRLTPQAFVDDSDDDGAAISIAGQSSRFNSIFIDGAVNNDVFGLSSQGTNGGQTGVSPISIDAIEQLEVLIAPYDVTKGGFTGGGINAVTRSGTNEFEGSVYYFWRNEGFAGKTPTDDDAVEREQLPEFTARTYGLRIGGPIIKDKLFFFVNAEIQDEETPAPFSAEQFNGDATEIESIRNFLTTNYNYDPGDFTNNVSSLESFKLITKIDWNINENHKLSARYSLTDAKNIDGFASTPNRINFSNNSEVFPSTTHSLALELKSTFGNNFANNLIIGYTRVEDDRGFAGNPFPAVTVDGGSGTEFRFGSEAFSTANQLEQDVFTITNNFNWFKGKHTITVGTHNEFYSISNVFIAQNFGAYEYGSVADLLNQATPTSYVRSFSLVDGDQEQIGDATSSVGAFDAYQLGFYVQDEFQISDRLKLTGGLRFDIPQVTTNPRFVSDAFTTTLPLVETYHDLQGARPGQTPNAQVYFSPRFGYNWDVFGDQKTQVRGGLGVFTGRVPFVWIGNMYLSNGGEQGRIDLDDATLADGSPLPLRAPDNAITAAEVGVSTPVPSGVLTMFSDDFRYPQVFRASVAVDQELPWGLIGTLEAVYTKNINAITHKNINDIPLTQNLNGANGNDTRIIEYRPDRADPRYSDIILAYNTNRGYSYNFTAQLQKPFDNGFTASLAWTYGDSFTINDGLSSQLASNWGRVPHVNGLQNPELGRSQFAMGHRVTAFVSYRKAYAKNFASTLSLFYNGQSGRIFSYTINNSRGNFDAGSRNNALFYVPRTFAESNLVDRVDDNGVVLESAEQQWFKLNQFIESDRYLNSRRGQHTERWRGRSPFEHILDLRFVQDVFIDAGGKKNTLQFTVDIFNFTNMLNKDWGRRYSVESSRTFKGLSVVDFEGFVDPTNGDFTPQYTYNLGDATSVQDVFDDSIQDSARLNRSRWMMQLGIRYIFN